MLRHVGRVSGAEYRTPVGLGGASVRGFGITEGLRLELVDAPDASIGPDD